MRRAAYITLRLLKSRLLDGDSLFSNYSHLCVVLLQNDIIRVGKRNSKKNNPENAPFGPFFKKSINGIRYR